METTLQYIVWFISGCAAVEIGLKAVDFSVLAMLPLSLAKPVYILFGLAGFLNLFKLFKVLIIGE